MLRLQKATVRDILAEAEASPTVEVCGLVWRAKGGETVYSLRNIHKDPERYYAVDPADMMVAYRRMDEEDGVPLAFYHSHPGGKPDPSEQDMAGALNVDLHYLIAYPWVPEFEKDQAAFYGAQGPVWRLSAWECISMQILIQDNYEVTE